MSFWILATGLALVTLALSNAWWRARLRRREAEFERWRAGENERFERWREELARERSGQESVLHCLAEGLLWLDPDGRIRLLNPPLRAWFGVEGEPRGRTILEVLRRHEVQELARRVVAEGQSLELELEVGGPPGRVLHVHATALAPVSGPTDEAGRGDRGAVLVFHDVTRLKELENTRREFVANVSHELRTPLSLIKGFVETLIDGAAEDPAVRQRFLQTIEKHANRLTFLIEDLLTVSQLESGQVTLNRQRGFLRPLVVRVCEDLAARAGTRGVHLVGEVPEDLEVRVDFDRLQQVLVNLVDNAIKYGRADGTVRIGARLDGERVETWVSDEGPGIPADALERVFERFYRVDAARSREQGGTGLGLSIVKHIVQAHGGEVRAESELGQGTTFRFFIPRSL